MWVKWIKCIWMVDRRWVEMLLFQFYFIFVRNCNWIFAELILQKSVRHDKIVFGCDEMKEFYKTYIANTNIFNEDKWNHLCGWVFGFLFHNEVFLSLSFSSQFASSFYISLFNLYVKWMSVCFLFCFAFCSIVRAVAGLLGSYFRIK